MALKEAWSKDIIRIRKYRSNWERLAWKLCQISLYQRLVSEMIGTLKWSRLLRSRMLIISLVRSVRTSSNAVRYSRCTKFKIWYTTSIWIYPSKNWSIRLYIRLVFTHIARRKTRSASLWLKQSWPRSSLI